MGAVGTGSVGLEALSRGVGQASFVEADPWVVSNVLMRNVASCGVAGEASVHTSRVEEFLKQGAARPEFCGLPFDFVRLPAS